MIFECADHTFGSVATVGVRGDKLEVNVVFTDGFLHCVITLVLEDVDIGVSTNMA